MTAAKQIDAFISHSRKDKLTARLVRGYLRSHNIYSWFDETEFSLSEEISESKIDTKIKKAIQRSRYFLLIISPNTAKSKWVKRELQIAKDHKKFQERLNGPVINIVGILLNPNLRDKLPKWLRSIRTFDVSGKLGEVDRLRELRDEIGNGNPTYIGDVEPNFLKQIPLNKLTDSLIDCSGDTLKMWYINGGYSLPMFIQPALQKIIDTKIGDSRVFRCEVLFTFDTKNGTVSSKEFDEKIYKRLIDSKFITNPWPHGKLIAKATEFFVELGNRYHNFSYDIRVTNRIPAGRIIFMAGIGFYGPYVGPADAHAPTLIFDVHSPFYSSTIKYFDEAYKKGKSFASKGPREGR